MQGGEIIRQKEGHPIKDVYWFLAFNGTEGVKALEFIKEQIDAGVESEEQHLWGKEFLEEICGYVGDTATPHELHRFKYN